LLLSAPEADTYVNLLLGEVRLDGKQLAELAAGRQGPAPG
jgi:hypothetical protein